MDILQTIYGIGPVLAKKLIKQLIQLGYDHDKFKLNEYKKSEIYKMLKNKNIWESLPESARAYLQYLPDRKIPRIVIEILDKELHKFVNGIRLTIAGSYRRGRLTSNDADIVVLNRTNLIEYIRKKISKSNVIEMLPPYAIGSNRISVMFRVNIPAIYHEQVPKTKYVVKSDIFITTPPEYKFMLLYATGSGGFNIMMRASAKRRGMLLNQHGLYNKDGTPIEITNEHEIFDKLHIHYRDPINRDLKPPQELTIVTV